MNVSIPKGMILADFYSAKIGKIRLKVFNLQPIFEFDHLFGFCAMLKMNGRAQSFLFPIAIK